MAIRSALHCCINRLARSLTAELELRSYGDEVMNTHTDVRGCKVAIRRWCKSRCGGGVGWRSPEVGGRYSSIIINYGSRYRYNCRTSVRTLMHGWRSAKLTTIIPQEHGHACMHVSSPPQHLQVQYSNTVHQLVLVLYCVLRNWTLLPTSRSPVASGPFHP